MQDPNEDTQWNDILRSKGIIPQKKEQEITEEDLVNLVEATISEKSKDGKNFDELTLDELDLIEDEEDERVVLEYRKKRMAEMKQLVARNKFGNLSEISGQDYVSEVNKAGPGIWVVLLLYKQGVPMCALLNEHLRNLALKFPSVKFLRSVSTTCIPNYPDRNLPTLFVYFEGEMKSQLVGPAEFRHADISQDELEWMLSKFGVLETELEGDPRPKPKNLLFSGLRDPDADDW